MIPSGFYPPRPSFSRVGITAAAEKGDFKKAEIPLSSSSSPPPTLGNRAFWTGVDLGARVESDCSKVTQCWREPGWWQRYYPSMKYLVNLRFRCKNLELFYRYWRWCWVKWVGWRRMGGGPQLNIRGAIVIWSPGKLDIYTGRNNIGCCFPFNNGINQCTDGRRWALIRSIPSTHKIVQFIWFWSEFWTTTKVCPEYLAGRRFSKNCSRYQQISDVDVFSWSGIH